MKVKILNTLGCLNKIGINHCKDFESLVNLALKSNRNIKNLKIRSIADLSVDEQTLSEDCAKVMIFIVSTHALGLGIG